MLKLGQESLAEALDRAEVENERLRSRLDTQEVQFEKHRQEWRAISDAQHDEIMTLRRRCSDCERACESLRSQLPKEPA